MNRHFVKQEKIMKNYTILPRILIAGAAGFICSHLCERLLEDGYDILCLDYFFPCTKDNITHLIDHPHFKFMCDDMTFPLSVEVGEVNNIACCPASPIHYQFDPVQNELITLYGNGTQTRSFCYYVEELIEGFV